MYIFSFSVRVTDIRAIFTQLAILYLSGTSVPQASWNLIGLGMRQVMEKGIHRRRGSSARPSKDEEILKRTFW